MTDTTLSRRSLIGIAAAGALSTHAHAWAEPELIDFHAHVDAAGTIDDLLAISKQREVKFGVVEHAGNRKDHRYRGLLANDDDLDRYLARFAGKPCLKGLQAEGLDWMHCFSTQALARMDYILTDALTFPEKNGVPRPPVDPCCQDRRQAGLHGALHRSQREGHRDRTHRHPGQSPLHPRGNSV